MALIHGKGAGVKMGTLSSEATLGCVESWSGDFKTNRTETTCMSATTAAVSRVAGLADGSFTITCKRKDDCDTQEAAIAAALAGTEISVILCEDIAAPTTKCYHMMAIVDVKEDASAGDMIKLTITGQNSDGVAPTYTPAA